MRIGLDLDEVLSRFVLGLVEYYNSTYKTSLKLEDFHSYKFWEVWGGTKEDTIKKVWNFRNTEYFKNLRPLEGSQQAVQLLSQNHELYVITSRPIEIYEETALWLQKNFPDKFARLEFTKNIWTKLGGDMKTKSELCKDLSIDAIIEDTLEYAVECASEGIEVLLLNYPWNQSNSLPKNITRFDSWDDILKYIG